MAHVEKSNNKIIIDGSGDSVDIGLGSGTTQVNIDKATFIGDIEYEGQLEVEAPLPDTDFILSLTLTGSNGTTIKFHVGVRDPNGVISADAGDLYFRKADGNSNVYINKSTGTGTVWESLFVTRLIP